MPRGRLPPSPLALTLLLVGALTLLRVGALFATPLELYPDEAQYWLWSRDLAWGYYSKPPMVAWLIAGTTALGGDGEPWIRLGATAAHAGAALALFAAGARLYDGWTGFWAAVIYSLMPGVQLSAGVMTTDAPMLLFLSMAVWAYAVLLRAEGEGARWAAAAALGAALGLAFLSKYAALYFALGLAVHGALDGAARRRWSPGRAATTLAVAGGVAAPNLLWNAGHDFATLSHTAENANWSQSALFNPAELLQFAGSQIAVFGLVPLAALALGAGMTLLRRRAPSEDLSLLCLALTPLLVVGVQAFISRANANWAVAAYAPASVLVAAWFVRRRARWAAGATVLTQGALAAVFLLAVVSPRATSALRLDNAFKRARGWEALSHAVTARAAAEPWTAVSVDDRFVFNAVAYYGRSFWTRPGAPPLRAWVREAAPQNQAEAEAALLPPEAGRVLHVSVVPAYAPEAAQDFVRWRPLGAVSVRLDPERTRDATLFEASGYRRTRRDPITGRPKAP